MASISGVDQRRRSVGTRATVPSSRRMTSWSRVVPTTGITSRDVRSASARASTSGTGRPHRASAATPCTASRRPNVEACSVSSAVTRPWRSTSGSTIDGAPVRLSASDSRPGSRPTAAASARQRARRSAGATWWSLAARVCRAAMSIASAESASTGARPRRSRSALTRSVTLSRWPRISRARFENWSIIASGTPATSAMPFSTSVQSTPRSVLSRWRRWNSYR